MTDRSILMSSPMVRALLAGRKTQTRRVVKLPKWSTGSWDDFELDADEMPMTVCKSTGCLADIKSPYGGPGDRLWVRETYGITDNGTLLYRANSDDWDDVIVGDGEDWRWRPSIFMPRWASRLTLEITSICVERVQDLTDADVLGEGVALCNDPDHGHIVNGHCQYRALWDTINAKRGFTWESNPFVWVLTFKVLG